jgi:hypothetical protein
MSETNQSKVTTPNPVRTRPRVNQTSINELLARAKRREERQAEKRKLKAEKLEHHGNDTRNIEEGIGQVSTGQEGTDQPNGSSQAGQIQAEQYQGLIKRVEELERKLAVNDDLLVSVQEILATLIPKEEDHGESNQHRSRESEGRSTSGLQSADAVCSEPDALSSEGATKVQEENSDGAGEVKQTGANAQ